MGNQSIEYGRRRGSDNYIVNYPIGASEVFKKAGGGFLKDDGSGRLEIANTDTNIIGHADKFSEDFTADATEGATSLPVDTDLQAHYELPIASGGTWADTMRGKTADLAVNSSVQEVDVAASAVDQVEIVEKGTTNPAGTVVSAVVKLFIPNLTRNGVA